MQHRLFTLMTMLALALGSLIHFQPCLDNNYSLDDELYLDKVTHVTDWTSWWNLRTETFSRADYRPVAMLSFGLEQLLYRDLDATRSHTINLILYIFCCWLVFYLSYIFSQKSNTEARIYALLVAVLFMSLPLHTSMLANIKSRDGLLSMLFGLLFLIGLWHVFITSRWQTRVVAGLMAAACLVTAIYSKIDAFGFIMFVPVLAAYHYSFKGLPRINLKYILRISLIVVISYRLFYFLFARWSISKETAQAGAEANDPVLFTENPLAGVEDLTLQVSMAVQTYFEYLQMVFAPKGHYFYFGYDMIPLLPLSHPVIIVKLILLGGIASIGLILLLRKNVAGFGILFFFVTLIYCSNLVTPVSGIVADRYAFIASLGACMAAAQGIIVGMDYLKNRSRTPFMQKAFSQTTAIWVVAFISFIYLPFNRSRAAEWDSILTLLDADMPHLTYRSYEANRIAVETYVETGMVQNDAQLRTYFFDKAIGHAKNALAIYDNHILMHEGIMLAEYGLGNLEEARKLSRYIIARFDTTEIGWRIMGEYYTEKRQLDSAVIAYQKVHRILPNEPEPAYAYLQSLLRAQQYQTAMLFTDSMILVQPNSYFPYQWKADLYIQQRDSNPAAYYLELAFEKGLRDNILLDYLGVYWWSRDRQHWESLKKYFVHGQ